jgi:hypothetical protein
MRRELYTIGDLGPWRGAVAHAMARHPTMRGARATGRARGGGPTMGLLAQPVFFGGVPDALQQAAANLYHRLLSRGCTTASFAECSAFQTAFNLSQGATTSRLAVDGKYGADTQSALDAVLSASSGGGGGADGLFSAPPSCFAAAPASAAPRAPVAPAAAAAAPVALATSAPSSRSPWMLVALLAGLGAGGFLLYKRRRRAHNPCGRMCRAA